MKKVTSIILCVVMLLSVAAVPVSAAKEKAITYTTADENYFEKGVWVTTDNPQLQSFDSVPSRYLAGEGNAYWVPELKHGKYKVSVYRTIHPSSLNNQVYEIVHHGKTDYAVVDFVVGEPGWVELGTFDFWGDGDDYVKVTREAGLDSNKPVRMHAISFELVEEIKTPIPAQKPAVIPGVIPDVEPITGETNFVEDTRKSTAVKPEKVGDV